MKNAERIAEDDALRSDYVRALLQSATQGGAHERNPAGSADTLSPSLIPRVLVQFWDSAGDIPFDVRECLDSWHPVTTEGFERVLFDDTGARSFIGQHLERRHLMAFDRCGHPAMRCDYFRLCYLVTFGGFYVDADEMHQSEPCGALVGDGVLKVQPMCYDLTTQAMVHPDVFLRSGKHSPGWIYYVNNNPIASPPRHPILRRALDRATHRLLDGSGRNGPGSRAEHRVDIQSTTGPGNLTAALVAHAVEVSSVGEHHDFKFINNWDEISISRWPLSYRGDERNWRLWKPAQ